MRLEGKGGRVRGPLVVLAVLLLGLGVVKLAQRGAAPDEPAPVSSGPAKAQGERPATQIKLSTTSLDFGLLDVRDTSVRQVVMRNDGASDVHLTLSAPETYSLNTSALTLAPGATATVSVTANGAEPGVLRDQLRIASSDARSPVLTVALVGRVKDSGDDTAANDGAHGGRRGPRLVDVARLVDGSPSGNPRRSMGAAGSASPGPQAAPGQPAATGAGNAAAAAAPAAVAALPSPLPVGAAARTAPFDPETSTPILSVAEVARQVSPQLTAEDRAHARPLPEQAPDGGDPEQMPPDLQDDDQDDPFADPLDDDDRDNADDDAEPPDPFTPTLEISGYSTVTMLGSLAQFYPQRFRVNGTDLGGPILLEGAIQFPSVSLAFGESLLINPVGIVSGTFDAASGSVTLQVPIAIVDSDGDAALIPEFQLTTGTSYRQNDAGIVVSLTGNPRDAGSGFLKLVGLGKVPVGYNNGAEEHLVAVEVLATLTFANTIAGGS